MDWREYIYIYSMNFLTRTKLLNYEESVVRTLASPLVSNNN